MSSSLFRLGSFNRGFTVAFLKSLGASPFVSDSLTMLVSNNSSWPRHSFSNHVGIGSSSYDVFDMRRLHHESHQMLLISDY